MLWKLGAQKMTRRNAHHDPARASANDKLASREQGDAPVSEQHAWWLNLDCELELQRPNGYNPSTRTNASLETHRERAQKTLLAAQDLLLPQSPEQPRASSGLKGRCWCPTTSALRALKAHGCVLPEHPSMDVLRAVNHRRFLAELGQTLPGAEYITSEERLFQRIEGLGHASSIVKRPFGFAGRGQRRLTSRPSPDDLRWLRSSIAQEGVQFEPYCELELELTVHGELSATGSVRFGALCGQRVDRHGAWQESFVIDQAELSSTWQAELWRSAEATSAALHSAGYFGPFGIDGFIYRDLKGQSQVNPRSDLNARYTMGFGLGMANAR